MTADVLERELADLADRAMVPLNFDRAGRLIAPNADAFDPDELRDETGKWTAASGAARAASKAIREGHTYAGHARAAKLHAAAGDEHDWLSAHLEYEAEQHPEQAAKLLARSAQHAAAVAAKLAPAEVVPEEHHDVRLLIRHVIPLTFR